jgi:hypothetical protein
MLNLLHYLQHAEESSRHLTERFFGVSCLLDFCYCLSSDRHIFVDTHLLCFSRASSFWFKILPQKRSCLVAFYSHPPHVPSRYSYRDPTRARRTDAASSSLSFGHIDIVSSLGGPRRIVGATMHRRTTWRSLE